MAKNIGLGSHIELKLARLDKSDSSKESQCYSINKPKSCLKCLLLGREQTRCRVSINSLFIYYFVTSNLCSYNKGFGGGGGS